MKVIGHRGAAGLALENSLESLQTAIRIGVDAIEFDIRITKDGHIVLNHDRHTGRVSREARQITEHTLSDLRKTPLNNGEVIPTLSDVINATQNTTLIIEGKEGGWAKPLATFLKSQTSLPPYKVISFNHEELYSFHLLMPRSHTYILERSKVFEAINKARLLGFTGIDINFWILNPLTYWLSRYHKLDIIVYTVNRPLVARFLKLFYPKITITTDVPDQMQFLRKGNHRSANS